MKIVFFILALVTPAMSQQPSAPQGLIAAAANPLAELKDEVQRVLVDARLPFTEDQERAVVLMMEDRRQASEDLFGNLMDFRAGPTQGQDADHLRSAIAWMREEFLKRLQDYLRPEQLAAWNAYYEAKASEAEQPGKGGRAPTRQQEQAQTQYVRINNNAFTAEDGPYRFGQGGKGQPAPQVASSCSKMNHLTREIPSLETSLHTRSGRSTLMSADRLCPAD
jgi:hypothetical protein